MKTLLTPAYGRDYPSKAKLLADFESEKDFIIADFSSPYDGMPANKQQFNKGDTIQFRFGNMRKTFCHIVK